MKKTTLIYFAVVALSIFLYSLTRVFLAGQLDIFGAVVYYHNWIDDLAMLELQKDIIPALAVVTAQNIAAPEFISAVLPFLLSRFVSNPIWVLHILNILYLVLFLRLATRNGLGLLGLLAIIELNFGYFSYVNIEMTHRLKIAFILLFAALLLHGKSKFLSGFFLFGSVLSHLTILLTLPIFILASRLAKEHIPSFSFWPVASIVAALIALILYPSQDLYAADLSFFVNAFQNKISNIGLSFLINSGNLILSLYLFFVVSIILLYLWLKRVAGFFPYWSLVIGLIIYIMTISIAIGTTRFFMLFYLVSFSLLLYCPRMLSCYQRRVFGVMIFACFAWSMYRSINIGMLGLIAGVG